MGSERLTDTRQRNAVSEGLALGVLMCGTDGIFRSEVASDFKIAVDFAFLHAWRKWPCKTAFPRVDTDTRLIDPIWIATRADERKRVSLFWERTDDGYLVRQRGRWPGGVVDLHNAALSIDGGLSAADWRALADPFLVHFRSA